MPLLVDHLAIAVLLLVVPLFSAREYRRLLARFHAGLPLDRRSVYRSTMFWQWSAFAVLMTGWWWLERPWSALGLAWPSGIGFLVCLGIGAAISGLLVWQNLRVRALDEGSRQAARDALGFMGQIIPHTDREVRHFHAVSLTAGIVEEVVYRGYVIAYLSTWLSPVAAVVLSSVVFGLGHAYQGKSGVLKTGAVGLLLGGLYVGSGTLWVPIVVHFLIDALQGVMARELWRSGPPSDNPTEPAPA